MHKPIQSQEGAGGAGRTYSSPTVKNTLQNKRADQAYHEARQGEKVDSSDKKRKDELSQVGTKVNIAV